MIQFVKKNNTTLILVSVISAFVFGIFTPGIFPSLSFLGDIFINLLKLFALPLIASALIAAMGDVGGSLSSIKSLARNVLSYMFVSEIIAVTIALVLFNAFKPGQGLDASLITSTATTIADAQTHGHELSLINFLTAIVPHNIFASLSQFDLLPVVFFSIVVGIACSVVGEQAKPLVKFALSVRAVSTTCLHGVMLLAPLGIFALVGSGIAQSSQSGNLSNNLLALMNFVVVLCAGLMLHAIWQVIVAAAMTKQKPFMIVKKSLSMLSTAFGTSSSVATLPIAMKTADQLKSHPTVTHFMLPLCATVNVGGMMMYEVAAALFFSQMLGFDLPIEQQVIVAIACILGGMAEGGIPESSMVSMVVVFKIVNVPISAISILLPLDRIIDRLRTMVNIFGNMCGVLVVSAVSNARLREVHAQAEEPIERPV